MYVYAHSCRIVQDPGAMLTHSSPHREHSGFDCEGPKKPTSRTSARGLFPASVAD